MASIINGNTMTLERAPQVLKDRTGNVVKISTVGGSKVAIRRVEPEDAMQIALSCYDSFMVSNLRLDIPPYLDYPSFENTLKSMVLLASTPEVYGVVAVDESSGAIMAGGFITPGPSILCT